MIAGLKTEGLASCSHVLEFDQNNTLHPGELPKTIETRYQDHEV